MRSRARGGDSKSLTKTVVELVTLGDKIFKVEADSLAVRFDDPVYEANRDIWEKVTRGGCRVFRVADEKGETSVQIHAMAGTRKFGYYENKSYGYRDNMRKLIAMEKENGENMQLAAFVHEGERYWTIGSKNVPMLLRHSHFAEDLAASVYARERYDFARKIADLFYRVVVTRGLYAPIGGSGGAADAGAGAGAAPAAGDGSAAAAAAAGGAGSADSASAASAAATTGPAKVLDFHDFLSSNGYAAVGEAIFLDSQHIVEYDRDTLRFFALVKPGLPSAAGLTALPPQEALAAFAGFGLETARIVGVADVYSTLPVPGSTDKDSGAVFTDEYTALCTRIGELVNSEGAVGYGLGEDGKVTYMYKIKSYEYVIARRARQIILGGLPESALSARLAELTKIGVPAEMVRLRTPYFVRFGRWLRSQKAFKEVFAPAVAVPGAVAGAEPAAPAGKKPAPNRRGAYSLQQQWVTFNKTFQEREAAGAGAEGGEGEDASPAQFNNGKRVIMLQGLPLTGKSTLARQLFVLLRRAGEVPRWLNQDEVTVSGKMSKRDAFLRQLDESIADPAVTHIIIDKSNINSENVDDYLLRGVRPSVTIRMRHPEDKPGELTKLLELCRERFYKRGTGHRTLRAPAGAAAAAAGGAGAAAAAPSTFSLPAKRKSPEPESRASAPAPAPSSGAGAGAFAALADDDDDEDAGAAEAGAGVAGMDLGGNAVWKPRSARGSTASHASAAAASSAAAAGGAEGGAAGGEGGADDWTTVAKPKKAEKKPQPAGTWGKSGGKGGGKGGKGGGSDEVDIDEVLGNFAGIDGAAAICGGVADMTQYDDEAGAGLTVNHSVLLGPQDSLLSIWNMLVSNGMASESLTPLSDHPDIIEEAIALAAEYEIYLSRYNGHVPPTRLWGVALGDAVRTTLMGLIPADLPVVNKDKAAAAAAGAGAGAGERKGKGAAAAASPAAAIADAAEGAGAAAADAAAEPYTALASVHHTLVWTGGFPDHETEIKYGRALEAASAASSSGGSGEVRMSLRVLGVAWDDKCIAALLDKASSESRNAQPHVTLALRRGVPPVYSNAMLQRLAADKAADRASDVSFVAVPGEGLVIEGKLARNPA